MDTQWTVDTHGDPLGTIRRFVHSLWLEAALDGMLVSLNGTERALNQPHLVDNPNQLEGINPFKPLMTVNAAMLVPDLIRQHPGARLGALLRPCEMRALIEMVKRDSFQIDHILTISVDCLGTVPADDYRWRAARKEPTGGLAQEALQFARQGGILAYRYRSACQVCVSPEAKTADVNINVLGLPVRQYILVQARDQAVAERYLIASLVDGPADPEAVRQHDHILARMDARHRRTMDRVTQNQGDRLPQDINALIARLEGCGDCQQCMQVCPICSVDFPHRDNAGHYRREDITRWMVSCAGCGMCEQSCPERLPLSSIFGHIRDLLADELGYVPGRSINDPLPVL